MTNLALMAGFNTI